MCCIAQLQCCLIDIWEIRKQTLGNYSARHENLHLASCLLNTLRRWVSREVHQMECDIDSFFITLGLGEDEVDGTGSAERALSTLLNEMDGIGEKKDVIVMACTRDKSVLDDAVLRPGRFVFYNLTLCHHCRSIDKHVHIGLPSLEDRLSIIDILSGRVEMSAEFRRDFAERMQGRSGAEIHLVLKKARQSAILDSMQEMEASLMSKRIPTLLSLSHLSNELWKNS